MADKIKVGDLVRLSEKTIRYWLGDKHIIDRATAAQQKSFIKGGIGIVVKIVQDNTNLDRAFSVAHIVRPDGEDDQWAVAELEKM